MLCIWHYTVRWARACGAEDRQTGPRCVAFSGLVGGAAERGGLATLGWVLGAEFREEGRLFRGLEWISFRLWYVRKG